MVTRAGRLSALVRCRGEVAGEVRCLLKSWRSHLSRMNCSTVYLLVVSVGFCRSAGRYASYFWLMAVLPPSCSIWVAPSTVHVSSDMDLTYDMHNYGGTRYTPSKHSESG